MVPEVGLPCGSVCLYSVLGPYLPTYILLTCCSYIQPRLRPGRLPRRLFDFLFTHWLSHLNGTVWYDPSKNLRRPRASVSDGDLISTRDILLSLRTRYCERDSRKRQKTQIDNVQLGTQGRAAQMRGVGVVTVQADGACNANQQMYGTYHGEEGGEGGTTAASSVSAGGVHARRIMNSPHTDTDIG